MRYVLSAAANQFAPKLLKRDTFRINNTAISNNCQRFSLRSHNYIKG